MILFPKFIDWSCCWRFWIIDDITMIFKIFLSDKHAQKVIHISSKILFNGKLWYQFVFYLMNVLLTILRLINLAVKERENWKKQMPLHHRKMTKDFELSTSSYKRPVLIWIDLITFSIFVQIIKRFFSEYVLDRLMNTKKTIWILLFLFLYQNITNLIKIQTNRFIVIPLLFFFVFLIEISFEFFSSMIPRISNIKISLPIKW